MDARLEGKAQNLASKLEKLHSFEKTFWVSAVKGYGVPHLREFLLSKYAPYPPHPPCRVSMLLTSPPPLSHPARDGVWQTVVPPPLTVELRSAYVVMELGIGTLHPHPFSCSLPVESWELDCSQTMSGQPKVVAKKVAPCSATLGHWVLDSDQATDMPHAKLAAEVANPTFHCSHSGGS